MVPNVLAFYDKNGPVIVLNEDNWLKEVLTTEHIVVVEFFAPWCGHSPEYKKAAENLKGLVKVGAVDCNDQMNKNVCNAYQIKGFPTIKLFPSKLSPVSQEPGKVYKSAKDYNGPRTAKGIVDFAIPEIPSFVQLISEKYTTDKTLTIEEFLNKKNKTISKAILFTSKDKTTPLYKALSIDFKKRLSLGEVRKREKNIIDKFNIKKFPTLIVITKETNEIIEYEVNPEIIEIHNQSQLESECLSKPTGICFFTFLVLEPEFNESITEHEYNLSILKKVKESIHKQHIDDTINLRFMWFNALKEESKKLINLLKLADVFPNLVALNPNRKVYKPYLGPYEEERIENFLKEVIKGKGKNYYPYEFDIDIDVQKRDEEKKEELKIEKSEEEEEVEKRDEEKKEEEKSEEEEEKSEEEEEEVEKRDEEKKEEEKSEEEEVEKRDDEEKKEEEKSEEEEEKSEEEEEVEKRDEEKKEEKIKIEKSEEEEEEKKSEEKTDEKKKHDEL
ncbi:380_t:CDS:2 [Diversispora eburnea]|uniref:protein disulfide-isomerase n=1 Tax=Diversispora eburnea TaxID=1213867 RepID=A0A9N8YS63_9GLOM|nr:380_t:CDS:2 [Diversispora eburnea]